MGCLFVLELEMDAVRLAPLPSLCSPFKEKHLRSLGRRPGERVFFEVVFYWRGCISNILRLAVRYTIDVYRCLPIMYVFKEDKGILSQTKSVHR